MSITQKKLRREATVRSTVALPFSATTPLMPQTLRDLCEEFADTLDTTPTGQSVEPTEREVWEGIVPRFVFWYNNRFYAQLEKDKQQARLSAN
jgi:hypothetical protein